MTIFCYYIIMNTKTLLQLIKKEFPKLHWKKFKIITKGWDFIVIILDNKLVFRFPRDKEGKIGLKKEINFLKNFKKHSKITIPDYKYIAKNYSLSGYTLIPGKDMKIWRYRKLTLNQKQILAKQIAKFLSDLHTTPISIMKRYDIKKSDPNESFKHLVKVTKKYILPKLKTKDIILIKNHFKDLKHSINDKFKSVFVHGDLGADHMLWNKNSIGIIDFGDIHIGDPAKDFSRLYKYGPKFVENIYQYYQGQKDINLLKRAQLNYKSIALRVMIGALKGSPVSFESGYKMFKERFKP